MFWSSISCVFVDKLILVLIALTKCQSLVSEHVHETCVTKPNANDIRLYCDPKQRIAIHEAFFTASVKYRCPFSLSAKTESVELTNQDYEILNSYPRIPSPCTDDLRLSINRRCSGASSCQFNLMKDHIPNCIGEDGSVIIKYTCVAEDKFYPFCNLNLTDTYGYVSTPGYPQYVPPYEKCIWKIEGGEGQIVQIDILDVSIKEPQRKSSHRKKQTFTCTDRLVLLEENTKMLTVCGEAETNLVQYRTKSNRLTIDFRSENFSPSRGILFRYSLQNCPIIPAPKNGHLALNGSYAYYSCCVDYVFEDTKEPDRVLYCQFGNHWNSTVPKCIAKESLMSSSLVLLNDTNNPLVKTQSDDKSDSYISDILIPVILMITLLLGNVVIVWVLFRIKQKQKHEAKNTESNVPLNSGSALQTNV